MTEHQSLHFANDQFERTCNDAIALIVVDLQVGLDDPQYGERCNPDCERNVQLLLNAWRRAKQPVFYTQHLSLRTGSPLARGSAGAAIKPELAPLEGGLVFEKSVNSAFKNPEFLEAVRSIDPVAIVVVGVATDACVTATARESKDLGYATMVVGEACATFSRASAVGPPQHPAILVQEVSLAALNASGTEVCLASRAVALVAHT